MTTRVRPYFLRGLSECPLGPKASSAQVIAYLAASEDRNSLIVRQIGNAVQKNLRVVVVSALVGHGGDLALWLWRWLPWTREETAFLTENGPSGHYSGADVAAVGSRTRKIVFVTIQGILKAEGILPAGDFVLAATPIEEMEILFPLVNKNAKAPIIATVEDAGVPMSVKCAAVWRDKIACGFVEFS